MSIYDGFCCQSCHSPVCGGACQSDCGCAGECGCGNSNEPTFAEKAMALPQQTYIPAGQCNTALTVPAMPDMKVGRPPECITVQLTGDCGNCIYKTLPTALAWTLISCDLASLPQAPQKAAVDLDLFKC